VERRLGASLLERVSFSGLQLPVKLHSCVRILSGQAAARHRQLSARSAMPSATAGVVRWRIMIHPKLNRSNICRNH
jgi:hypothetical protein